MDLVATRPLAADATLSIGELARRTAASVRSLRHYDAHGLLASTRADNGYRVFAPVAVVQVRQIQQLIAIGFNLEQIGAFPECMRMVEGGTVCADATQAMLMQLAVVERDLAALEQRRASLRKALMDGTLQVQTST